VLRRANKYCAVPTPYQAAGHGAACQFVHNITLEQRIDTWRRGVRLDYTKQVKELTTGREMVEWLGFARGHALQDVEDALRVSAPARMNTSSPPRVQERPVAGRRRRIQTPQQE
jgi:hypothetical protein